MEPVMIIGAGVAEGDPQERPSHAELLYRSTRVALDDAGLEREAITTAVTSSYDYVEGRPLSNQFTLDSIGGVMKSCDLRLGDDGMHALAAGAGIALSDPGAVVVVAAVQLHRSEHSDETHRRVQELTYEPVWTRPVVAGAKNAEAIAFGLRAQRYMAQHGVSEDDLADLVSRRSGGNGSRRSLDEILGSAVLAGPLRELHIPPNADVAATLLLSTAAPDGRSRAAIRGVGWAAYDGMLGGRELVSDEATASAASDAYARAGVESPASEVDRVEAYNVYGIDELQALEALELAPAGAAIEALKPSAGLAVNPNGGVQSQGWAPGAASLAATVRALDELDADAEGRSLVVTQGWTGCGGCSSAVAVIEHETKGAPS
jgi:acetyl-CoA C-acetyltransferase